MKCQTKISVKNCSYFDTYKECGAKGISKVNGIWYCGRHNPNKKRSSTSINADIDRLNRHKEKVRAKKAFQFLETKATEGEPSAVALMKEIDDTNKEYIHELKKELAEK